LSNAIRYTNPGGSISVKTAYNKFDKLYIIIINDGALSSMELDKIWTRYYKVEKKNKMFSDGTGLGLEITSKILELHNSTYGVKSSNSKIIFYFTLDICC